MDYNSPENLAACYFYVKQAMSLLYYSHIPAAGISLLIGLFVLIKNRGSLVSKLLFAIAFTFSLWVIIDLVVWLNYDKNTLLMFSWAFFGVLYALIYIFSLYFVYVFIDKRDISFTKKIIFGFILLPIIVLTPTSFNLESFNTVDCIAMEGSYFTNYYYFVGLAVFIWILAVSFLRYRKADKELKKQILLLTVGIGFFLLSFFISGFLASYLIDSGYISGGDYGFEQYGLFGMPIFMAFLAYLIVKFEAFDIKMFGAQALVAGLVILIGSQFFFIRSFINQVLTGITLALSIVFGWALIHSVKLEIERKDELQKMSTSLALANDKLRKLDNAKSEFISIASHQLRTPLTAIKGFISLILEDSYGKVSAEIRDVLNKVYISNERLIELVEDLLNLSRIESGRMEYTFEKTNLGDLCQEIYDTFALRAREKELRLELILPENSTAEANTDRSKVREVISNMVDNALKYTIKGGVKMKISEDNTNVLVAIIDTGIGVPEEEMPYLFSKFSRGKDINRLNAGGTGLGLHVARKVMEAVGGRIWVESAGTNLGSTFFLEIPKEHAEEKN